MKLRQIGVLAPAVCFAALLFCAPPAARANTYLFSFTAGDLLDELQTSDPAFNTAGYYAVFLQPQSLSHTNGSEVSPKPTGADKWKAGTVNNIFTQSFLGLGTWIQFSKLAVQDDVTLVSRFGANFLGNTYSDLGDEPPLTFGPSGQITSIMNETAVFKFTLDTASLSGPVNFTGWASKISSQTGKPEYPVGFSMELTGSQVPEPGTFVLIGFGAIGIALSARKRFAIRKPE